MFPYGIFRNNHIRNHPLVVSNAKLNTNYAIINHPTNNKERNLHRNSRTFQRNSIFYPKNLIQLSYSKEIYFSTTPKKFTDLHSHSKEIYEY